MELPEFERLTKTAKRYLAERGLTNPEKYGIMELVEGTRLVFPYFGPQGRIIYWSTRAYHDDGKPKYVTAPGRHPLYVLPNWKPRDQVFIVEGIMDAIATYEATGVPVIALGGKVLPRYLRQDLRELAPGKKIIMLDGDAAGIRGAIKLKAQIRGATIHPLPDGKDPADYFREGGKVWFEESHGLWAWQR